MAEEVLVYVDKDHKPTLVGVLWIHRRRGNQRFTFRYASAWLNHPQRFALDPHLPLSTTSYHSPTSTLFGAMDDTTPDRWGRDLLRRVELHRTPPGCTPRTLGEIEMLLGVSDMARLGALRFKKHSQGDFLAPSGNHSVPPVESLAKLLAIIQHYDAQRATAPELEWLLAPGASMGGARPKACLLDHDGHLLLAKFPRQHDRISVVLWEAVALSLAARAGIQVGEWRVERCGDTCILLLQRFDRKPAESSGKPQQRVPFLSALNALGLRDGAPASYQDIAGVIRQIGITVCQDLKELWRRMVFNIMISNTDDHLRNHALLYDTTTHGCGWRLSPAYDLNPSPPTQRLRELTLGVRGTDTRACLKLALSTCQTYNLDEATAKSIISTIAQCTKNWRTVAKKFGLSHHECNLVASAFDHENLDWALGLPNHMN